MPRRKKVTLAMLAKELGLSEYTVSKALRGQPGMSEQTRQDVLRLAGQRGYLTKEQENSLVYEGIPLLSAKYRRFLMVVPLHISVTNCIYQMFQGIKERLLELGHHVDFAFLPHTLTERDFAGWVEREGVLYADGLFITPLIPEPQEKWLLGLKLPRLLVNYPPVGAKVDSVIWDVYDATRQSVQHMTARGHRRILFLGEANRTRGYKQRWMAFQESMREAEVTVREEEHILEPAEPHEEKWSERFKRKLEAMQPTGMLCASERNMAWILYICSKLGYRIPQDLSLIGLDHIRNGFVPGLTHPVLLAKETGCRAADRMLWRIANPHLPHEHIRLQGPFFAGSTVADLTR